MASTDTSAARGQWNSKFGFIMAAAGSAIGLGNIWRYPYVVYENGGGAFLIPYFVALATAGIPLLILEYSLGHRARRGGPGAYAALNKRWESLGWFQSVVAFFISTFYVVILAWALAYLFFSFGSQWGKGMDETGSFFTGDFLGVSDSFWAFGGLNWKVLLPLAVVWAFIYYLMRRGVSKGIELASKVMMPVLIVMMLIIVVRGITLPNATVGLNQLFTPDFTKLGTPGVWLAAYGQVFFSLSVGFATMLTYASYLKRKTDITNTALIVGLSNAGFEFLAAIGVFSVIGFFAADAGVPVQDAAQSGPGLAFVAIPAILSELPASGFFGVLFFLSLLFAGITSLVSLIEPPLAAVREKFHLTRNAAVNWICGVAAVISLVYATHSGLMILDTADHFLNTYALVLGALAMTILISWIGRRLGTLQEHLNEYSYIRAGAWWTVTVGAITPILLGVMTVFAIRDEITKGYPLPPDAPYPMSGILVVGVGVLVLSLVLSVILPFINRETSPAVSTVQKSGEK